VDREYVPTQREIWDFLVSLKEVTESSFLRVFAKFDGVESRLGSMESRLAGVESRLATVESRLDAVEAGLHEVKSDMRYLEERLSRRLAHTDDRLSAFQAWVMARLGN
jgi:uncharacterized coiled-coil protein SlyX